MVCLGSERATLTFVTPCVVAVAPASDVQRDKKWRTLLHRSRQHGRQVQQHPLLRLLLSGQRVRDLRAAAHLFLFFTPSQDE